MSRPSLTAALAHLAELRTQRDALAKERRRGLIRDDPDPRHRFIELDAERLTVEAEIREALGLVVHLRVRTASRAPSLASSVAPAQSAGWRMATAG